jgi:hypothetical protein
MASQIAACQLDETAIFRRNQNFMLKLDTSSIEWRGFKTTKKWSDMPSNQHLQFQTPNKGSFKPPIWENQSILLKKNQFRITISEICYSTPQKGHTELPKRVAVWCLAGPASAASAGASFPQWVGRCSCSPRRRPGAPQELLLLFGDCLDLIDLLVLVDGFISAITCITYVCIY